MSETEQRGELAIESPLLNEAFCAVLLHYAVKDYTASGRPAMPLPFAYVVLPMALHEPSRRALPRTTAAAMWPWVHERAEIMAGMTRRVVSLRAYASRALLFGQVHGVIVGTADGIAAGQLRRRPRSLRPTADWNECVRAAGFLGRWFASQQTDTPSTLAMWGLRP